MYKYKMYERIIHKQNEIDYMRITEIDLNKKLIFNYLESFIFNFIRSIC